MFTIDIMNHIFTFFSDNFPSLKAILLGGPPGIIWAYACLYLAGWLKRNKGVKTGYTRKIFHFLIFMSAAGIDLIWGLSGVFLLGASTSLVILYALIRGNGHLLYEAMAREKDAPYRTYYIIAPYFATLIGGLTSNLIFGHAAFFGYLVTGIGDAIGEPVGVRFGKHVYPVPSLSKVKSFRSLEGSGAIFLSSIVMILLGVILNPQFSLNPALAWKIPLLALTCAIVEAVSPHGWDNATMQIIPVFLISVYL